MDYNYWFPPDHQRERLYRAERVLPDTWKEDTHLNTIPQIESWIRTIIRKKWFQERWPHIKDCRVESSSWGSYAEAGFDKRDSAILSLPKWSRSESAILHELAHACVPPKEGFSHHSPEYAGAYLFLVEKILGKEEADQLRESFIKNKVKYRMPKTKRGYRRRPARKKQAALRVGV